MMFCFTKVATFALLTLGVAASAVPAKRQTGSTAVEILDSLTAAVSPIAAQFAELTPANATVFNVQNIIGQITPLISEAASNIAKLSPGSGDKNATINSLANVISAILKPGQQLVTTPGVNTIAIVPIFTQLGLTLAALLSNVVTLLQEILTVVVDLLDGLIAGLGTTLEDLGLTGL